MGVFNLALKEIQNLHDTLKNLCSWEQLSLLYTNVPSAIFITPKHISSMVCDSEIK